MAADEESTSRVHPVDSRGVSEGEAGIGADNTGSTPVNVRLEVPEESQQPAPKDDDGMTGGRSVGKIVLIMGALCMAVFLAALDTTIVTTALPTITQHFHSSAAYTWVGSAYLLANAASTPSWGKFSDIFGRKPVLLVANVVFMIGSLITALSVNVSMLIVGRAIQGVGGGGLIILVNICISDLFSMRHRGAYFGMIGMVWALASALGPVLGGVFTEKVSWRWCFYINLPLDGAAFIIIFLFLDIHTPKTPFLAGLKAIDWLGSLSIIGGTLMFLLGLEFGGVTFPWSSATVICLIVFGLVVAVFFVLNEWKLAKYPVMPVRLFKHRSNVAALCVCFVHGMVFISASYYLPMYFQAVKNATPLMSGVEILPIAVSLSLVSAATGIFIRKTGRYREPIWFGMTLITLGWGLIINIDAGSNWAKLVLYQIVAGIGVGPNFQSPLIALQSLVEKKDIAVATATFGFTRNLATSISVVIGGVVFQNRMKSHADELSRVLGPELAAKLSGGDAGANVLIVDQLHGAQRDVARHAFASSLQSLWIMYTCFAAFGLLISFLITEQKLSKEHKETETGLHVEEAKRRETLAAQADQRAHSISEAEKDKEQV
ncbi:DNA repair protein RAD50 [Xylona heveae TC161]|uniref:Efflux pump dotC n=1 Tax=Xylona heveae (strain CBS 132557 / TC161) TaxID=1328760 RepID=A0A165JF90_XYLHT|nr:DNA repair protein RAD50 [Xylona heveae TC161]KZF26158.1 DNA repair protein RAD50 [Xylona heveae TC161]